MKAEKITAQRSGVVVWTDGVSGGGTQDFATYGATVSDQMVGYLNLEVKTGNMKLIKTSEDGKVEGISFTITGEGYSATKTTNSAGEIDITDLNPGVYTVTEQSIDKYEPQATQRVTIVSGQTATVNFNNVLKRGSLEVTKTSEDGLVEGMTFHLYGTSLSGLPVDEYAVTDSSGVARFENVLIGSDFVLEEVDTPIRYVVPEAQSATIAWNEVTHKSVNNVLKKFRVTVTKSDVETGAPQGDGSLAGATYGLYKGDTLIDSYTTDENGQFTTDYYVCDSDWTIREINPSEGYLLDSTIHKVGAEPELYEIELNDTANDVTEQVIKGNIAIIKHTDDGETQIETPETGAEFQIYLKAAGSYADVERGERGSSEEHLTVMQFKVEREQERLEQLTAQTQQKEQQAASLEKKIEKIQKQQIAVQEVEQIEPHPVPFSSKVMLDRSEYENLAAAAKKFYVQERKESKLQKALDAAMKMISELKAKIATLTAELAEYKSVRGQFRIADLEKENSELRGKLRKYEDVISRNNLWSYFSWHRRNEIDREELR